jgi:hypothetical protein
VGRRYRLFNWTEQVMGFHSHFDNTGQGYYHNKSIVVTYILCLCKYVCIYVCISMYIVRNFSDIAFINLP